MMDIRSKSLRELAFQGMFGLERESLRITADGRFAATPHPFHGSPRIVRDFCENQTEINTHVHSSVAEAVEELREIDVELRGRLAELPEREWLWPFSNPPPISGDSDIRPAAFDGPLAGKGAYREYLSAKYGRRLMTFCGIHFNFSFGPGLVAAAAAAEGAGDVPGYVNRLYLHVAEQLLLWGWAVVPLTAASPVLDASYLGSGAAGDDFVGMASVRCSELGYWNHFTPVLDFSDVRAYADSIMRYVKDGLIAAPSELYYPIRLKPRGPNRVASLVTGGVDHLELRCLDLNPFEEGRIDRRDAEFIHLLALWCAGRRAVHLTASAQVQAVRNYKNAARFDLESAEIVLPDGSHASVRESVLSLIDAMDGFYADFPDAVKRVLAFERRKIEEPDTRPAARVLAEFRGTFAAKGLAWAKGI